MEQKTLYKSDSHGGMGFYGIEIKVAATNLPDLDQKEIRIASRKAAELIEVAIRGKIQENDPKTKVQTLDNRKIVDQVFEEPIFVEEIENGYCKDWCCTHLPWFIVTTKVGRFTIGWRKRVINIDWSETVDTKLAKELFKDQDVTKWDKGIHAWSIEDAKRYVKTIIDSINN